MENVMVAAVSMATSAGGKLVNLAHMSELVKQAAQSGAKLVVFPDGALTDLATEAQIGYSDEDMQTMYDDSETIPGGPSTAAMETCARDFGIHICWGMAERADGREKHIYNAAVLVGPEGYIGKYRKATIGPKGITTVKMGVRPPDGSDYPVFDTPIGKIGLQISRDLEYDEVAYLLAHEGAQIIASVNYWPNESGTDEDPSHLERERHLVERSKAHDVVIVDANRSGKGLDGRSMVSVPYSDEPIASTGDGEGIAKAFVKLP